MGREQVRAANITVVVAQTAVATDIRVSDIDIARSWIAACAEAGVGCHRWAVGLQDLAICAACCHYASLVKKVNPIHWPDHCARQCCHEGLSVWIFLRTLRLPSYLLIAAGIETILERQDIQRPVEKSGVAYRPLVTPVEVV